MKVIIGPAALSELQAAADYYVLHAGTNVARDFVDEFERVVQFIATSPQLGAIFRGNRRRYFLRKFPYSVIYQASHDELRVLALSHHRRRPNYWAKRK
nr:type II toxin-antitoxin system RelE/ParE family toxin [uncultured Duganella sp.]